MTDLMWILYSCAYLAFAVIFLWLGKKVFDWATPYSVNVQLTEKDNPAVGVVLTGFLLGLAAIICGVFIGETAETPSWQVVLEEMGPVALYGGLGLLLLWIAGFINDKVVLYKFSNRQQIVESRNTAVAVVMGSTYLGSSLVIAGGIRGSVDIVTLLVSFALGQVALTAFGLLYQVTTRYDDQKELGQEQNLAAALGFGGSVLAYSLILMKGLSMDQLELEQWTWGDRLVHAGYYAGVGLVLLVVARFITDRVFLPKAKISEEIVRDRNLNAGLMEAALALSVGAALVFCV